MEKQDFTNEPSELIQKKINLASNLFNTLSLLKSIKDSRTHVASELTRLLGMFDSLAYDWIPGYGEEKPVRKRQDSAGVVFARKLIDPNNGLAADAFFTQLGKLIKDLTRNSDKPEKVYLKYLFGTLVNLEKKVADKHEYSFIEKRFKSDVLNIMQTLTEEDFKKPKLNSPTQVFNYLKNVGLVDDTQIASMKAVLLENIQKGQKVMFQKLVDMDPNSAFHYLIGNVKGESLEKRVSLAEKCSELGINRTPKIGTTVRFSAQQLVKQVEHKADEVIGTIRDIASGKKRPSIKDFY
ncbi:MAG: hypothetical protein V4490_02365 [Pseudomonadota bacterium]